MSAGYEYRARLCPAAQAILVSPWTTGQFPANLSKRALANHSMKLAGDRVSREDSMKRAATMVAAGLVAPLLWATASFAERPFDHCVSMCMDRRCPQMTGEKWVCAKKVRGSCIDECRRSLR